MYTMKAIDGRLVDAGLPRWCSYPVFTVWILATSIPFISPRYWPAGIGLLLLLLVAGGLMPSQPAPAILALIDKKGEPEEGAARVLKKFPAGLLVGPVGYLYLLLTFACIWLPLVWLEDTSADQLQTLIAHLGYFIMGLVWVFTVLGRFEDSGRASDVYGVPYCIIVPVLSMLPLWRGLINGYETLALFVLIQVPLALLRSKPTAEEPVLQNNCENEASKVHAPPAKTNELTLCGPFEYLRILFVIACFSIPLIYMDDASGGSVGSWIARLGYLILGFFWLTFANGRLEDAGWTRRNSTVQFGLVVCAASLMPLAFHWVSGYGSLAIFVVIQTPTALLRSKPKPEEPLSEEPLPGSGGRLSPKISENLELKVSHDSPEDGEAYPQQRPPIFTGISSGGSKKASRWKPY
ncbi:MAG: hypothetical protein WAK26_07940 [Terracidiphilus sp.]